MRMHFGALFVSELNLSLGHEFTLSVLLRHEQAVATPSRAGVAPPGTPAERRAWPPIPKKEETLNPAHP